MKSTIALLLLIAVLAGAAFLPGLAQAAPRAAGPAKLGERPNQVRGDEITAAQQRAVELGLDCLAKRQLKSGGFGADGGFYGGGSGDGHVGITALAGVAFMAAGNLPGRGKYGENVQRIVEFLCARTDNATGFISSGAGGEMYSHGFATLFLGEVYGMTGNDEVKEKLIKAIKLIQRCQNREGGWRYQPAPVDADISITICQVMGLRAARDAGIKVEKEVIDNAVKYVQRCSCPDGGFSYTANQGGGSGFARSAAGVATLFYAGAIDSDAERIKRGVEYLMQFLPSKAGGNAGAEGHYFYGHYYAAQAMFLAGGDNWAKWYPAIREQLLQKQVRGTGGWAGEAGNDYATAMALIILQMPNRYLPVFHGKGPGS